MNEQFKNAWVIQIAWKDQCTEWLGWIGQPLLYDGGLCVNRSLEEQQESDKFKGILTL